MIQNPSCPVILLCHTLAIFEALYMHVSYISTTTRVPLCLYPSIRTDTATPAGHKIIDLGSYNSYTLIDKRLMVYTLS